MDNRNSKSTDRLFESNLKEIFVRADILYSGEKAKHKFKRSDFESMTSLEAIMAGRASGIESVIESDGGNLGLGFNKYFQPYFSDIASAVAKLVSIRNPKKVSLKALAKLNS